jgi:hypothetical protein
LSRLAADVADTRITWITRRETASEAAGPIPHVPNDPLTARDALAQQANLLALRREGPVTHWPATFVESVSFDDSTAQFQVEFAGRHGGHATFDSVVANVGHRPDHRPYDELQVQRHPATDGAPPAAGGSPSVAEALLSPEPDFYVLGAKSYGRDSKFLLSDGREQIRALFTILGDRAGLNLYASHRPA